MNQQRTTRGSEPSRTSTAGASSQAPAEASRQRALRGASYEDGAAMLSPRDGASAPRPPTDGAQRRPGSAQRNPTAEKKTGPAAPGRSPASDLPAVDLRAARVSFNLPARRQLAGSALYDAATRSETSITVAVSPEGLEVSASPLVPFDVTWPGQNMSFGSAGIDFASGEVSAHFYRDGGLGSGFIDVTQRGAAEVKRMIRQAIAGTPMARPGYNPFQDSNLQATLQRIKANFDALPSQGAPNVEAREISSPRVGATLAMRTPFFREAGAAGLRIGAGGQFDVDIQGSGELSRLLQAGNPQSAAMAANIQHVDLQSEAIELLRGGEPVARLQQLRIHRGGQVTIQRFEMLGGLGAGAGIESLFRLLVGVAALSSQGASPELAANLTVASGGAEPEFTRGLSRAMIEQGLTDAVRTLLRDNRSAVPGLDLSLVFGVR